MNEFSNEVHVNLDVFVALILKWIFRKIESTLILTPNGG
jgi:hypothetical protein